jgi:RND family efflux transporter MFP subunit
VDIRTEKEAGLYPPAVPGATKREGPPKLLRVLLPILVVGLAVGGVVLLSMTAKKADKSEEAPLALAVEIAPVKTVRTNLQVTAQGEVKSKTEADVAARVGGQIVYVSPAFEPGAPIKAGDVLARVDAADYRLAVERARSQVSRARENLERIRSEAALAQADWKELDMKGDPSDLTLLKPQVASATADLRTAEAAVREAELNLQRTDVVAPFDGRVKARRVDAGDFVAPGAPVASLFAVDVAQVRAPLTDQDLAVLGVAPGYVATGADAGPRATVHGTGAGVALAWEGRLTLVEAAFDPATRLVYGLIEVKDPFASATPLAPGMFVAIDLKGRSEETLFAIPRGAFKKNEIVYTVEAEGAIKGHRLVPAHANAREVFFREGLKEGDRVVVSYLPAPRDGMKVRDVNDPVPPKTEPETEKGQKKAREKKTDKQAKKE